MSLFIFSFYENLSLPSEGFYRRMGHMLKNSPRSVKMKGVTVFITVAV